MSRGISNAWAFVASELFALFLCACRPHAYYAAKVAATTPFQIVSALVFSFIVYGMAGLRPGAQYIWESGIISTLLSLIAVQVKDTGV
jgi:hypothetical protein